MKIPIRQLRAITDKLWDHLEATGNEEFELQHEISIGKFQMIASAVLILKAALAETGGAGEPSALAKGEHGRPVG